MRWPLLALQLMPNLRLHFSKPLPITTWHTATLKRAILPLWNGDTLEIRAPKPLKGDFQWTVSSRWMRQNHWVNLVHPVDAPVFKVHAILPPSVKNQPALVGKTPFKMANDQGQYITIRGNSPLSMSSNRTNASIRCRSRETFCCQRVS